MKRKQGRDPTIYIPGQEDRPDPDSEKSWFSDVIISCRYCEDPPLKPKREPTMYFDGKRSNKDPSLMPMHDPTVYIDGHWESDMYTVDSSTVEEVHNDYHFMASNMGWQVAIPLFMTQQARIPPFMTQQAVILHFTLMMPNEMKQATQ